MIVAHTPKAGDPGFSKMPNRNLGINQNSPPEPVPLQLSFNFQWVKKATLVRLLHFCEQGPGLQLEVCCFQEKYSAY